MVKSLANRMMNRFGGYDAAYGSYDPNVAKAENGVKVEIKSSAYTKRGQVTVDLWKKHINGTTPLGIIPLRDNNTCVWGCIDVDDYTLEITDVVERCLKEELPAIVCKTKSGGAHIFFFFAEPVPASSLQSKLHEVAALLGLGDCEVFPKQVKVALERGDLGNWLNMPYFGKTRFAHRVDGTALTIEEFLDLADSLEQAVVWLEQPAPKKRSRGDNSNKSIDFKDGPPCMQHLAEIGLGEGSRNNGLFNMGIFAKKKYYSSWQSVLEQWNRDITNGDPLDSQEMLGVIKRLDGEKEYQYRCKQQPIVSYCNSSLCRTRRYGVGGEDSRVPRVTGLSVLNAMPRLWFMDVDGFRVELTTPQLQNFKQFQQVCIDVINVMYQDMRQKDWGAIVDSHLKNLTKIDVSEEIGYEGEFRELLQDFFNEGRRAEKIEEVLASRPFLDDSDKNSDNHVYLFKLKDLIKFLNDAGFTILRPVLYVRLRQLGAYQTQRRVIAGEDGTHLWALPVKLAPRRAEPFSPMNVEEDPI